LGGYTQRGPQLAFADQNDTPIPDVGGPPMVDQPSVECTTSCPSGKTGSCGGHKYWIWAEQRYGDCQCETEAQTCQAPQPPAAPTCPKDGVVGTTKDDQGCTRNIHTREDCSQYLGGPFACPAPAPAATPQPPAQQQQQQQQQQEQPAPQQTQEENQGQQQAQSQSTNECPSGTCVNQTTTPQQNNEQTNEQTQEGTNLTTGDTSVTTGSTSVTTGSTSVTTGNNSATGGTSSSTSNPSINITLARDEKKESDKVTTVTRVVTAQAQPRVVQVAGVSAQQVTELPKTGVPALAWAAAAFLPLGFRLKRFGSQLKLNKSHDNHPHLISLRRKNRV